MIAHAAIIALVLSVVGMGAAVADVGAPGLGGVVTDVEGAPLAGVTVSMGGARTTGGYWYGSVLTDAAGHFEFREGETAGYGGTFDAGVFDLDAWFDDNRMFVYESFAQDGVVVGDTFATMDVTLHRYPAVAGTITNESGDPVATGISMLDENGYSLGQGWAADDGTYRVSAYTTGSARIGFATSSGSSLYVPQYFNAAATLAEATPVTLTQDVTVSGIDAVLHQGAVVTGSVSRTDGGPLGGFRVVVFDDANPDVVTRTAVTNPDGSYAVPGLLPGSYYVAAVDEFAGYRPGLGYKTDWFYGTGRTVPASPNVTVSGAGAADVDIVIGGTTSASITPSPADPTSGSIRLDNTRGTEATSFTVVIGAGSQTYPVAAGATVDLPFGGGLSGGTDITVSEGGVAIAGYRVPRSSIAGRVTDGVGAPLSGVSVRAQPVGGGIWQSGWTDTDGTYTISNVDPGDYRVEFYPSDGDGATQYYDGVTDPTAARVFTIGPATYMTGIDAQITGDGAISGTVLTAPGSAAGGAVVRLYRTGDLSVPVDEATVAADGSYAFTGLSMNTYAIEVGTGTSLVLPRWFGASGTQAGASVITLTHTHLSEAADVTVQLGGVLTGVLADAGGGGGPVASTVTIYDASGAQVQTLASSGSLPRTWTSQLLPAGEYRVMFTEPGRTAWWGGGASLGAATPITVAGGATVHADFTFPPPTVSGAATGVVGSNATSTSIDVSWTPPANTGGSPITRYVVSASTDGGVTWSLFGYPPTAQPLATTWTWTGLTPGTSYKFRVHVQNGVGWSLVSAPSAAVSTLSTPSAPRSVTGVAGPGQVALSWTAPLTTGGSPITGYGVDYSSNGGATWTTAVAPSAAMTATSYTVTGLTNGTGYVFRVVAANVNGAGAWSATTAAYTPRLAVPDAATGVTASNATSTSVVVSWTPPANTGGSPITRYVVSASTDGGATWTLFGYPPTAQPLATSWTWTGLTPGTSYKFRVHVQNGVGWSPVSAPSAAISTLSTPSAPRSVTGTAGPGQVALSWTAPLTTGGSPITGYGVDYSSNGGATWTTAVAPSASMTATTYTVTGLTNGTAYVFRVVAANVNGAGTWSATTAAYTPRLAVPGAATGVTASNATSTSVVVSWTPPANNGGSPITRYVVSASTDGGATWTLFGYPSMVQPLATSWTWTGLTPGTSYKFRVHAQNGVGWSPVSAPSPAISTTP